MAQLKMLTTAACTAALIGLAWAFFNVPNPNPLWGVYGVAGIVVTGLLAGIVNARRTLHYPPKRPSYRAPD